MNILILICRLLLAGVFLIAGLAKLSDKKGTFSLLQNFGLPYKLIPFFALLLPLVELTVGTLLVLTSTLRVGALGELLLLTLFTAIIITNLAKGRNPDCRCFGQINVTPIGWNTLIRNSILLALAGLIAWKGETNSVISIFSSGSDLVLGNEVQEVFMVLTTVLLFIMGWLFLQLYQQEGRILARLEAVEALLPRNLRQLPKNATNAHDLVGNKAPDFTLSTLSGDLVSLEKLLEERKNILLVFSDPNCGPCNALLPSVALWQQTKYKYFTIVMITRGTIEDHQQKATQHGLKYVLLQEQYEINKLYHVGVTPGAVLIHKDGRIGSPVVAGAVAINALVTEISKE